MGTYTLCKSVRPHFRLPLSSDNFVIFSCCYAIYDCIKHSKHSHGDYGTKKEQRRIGKVQCDHKFLDDLERHGHMQHRHEQRQEEHGQYLTPNGTPDFFLIHAYILHDLEPLFVVISLRYLFIVNGFFP